MDRAEAELRIREVQRIMERTTLYTLLPAWPAIIGGLMALGACAVTLWAAGSLDFAGVASLSTRAQVALWAMWAAIAAVGVAIEILWARSASRQLGVSPVARPARFAVWSLSPSVFVALVLTVGILHDGRFDYLAPVWIMCYGTGLYAAGLFSVRLPRLLGLAFIATGALGFLALPRLGILLVGVAFGLYHIAFGIAVLRRSRRTDES
jgi:hypothetical protein